MDAQKRNALRKELVGQGYSWEYLDKWPAKVGLYLHRPMLNTAGDEAFPVGYLMPNQPGHPDHVARKSRIGWLPWPPSESCKCKACRERTEAPAPVETAKVPAEKAEVAAAVPSDAKPGFAQQCELCDFVAASTLRIAMLAKLKGHVNKRHAAA